MCYFDKEELELGSLVFCGELKHVHKNGEYYGTKIDWGYHESFVFRGINFEGRFLVEDFRDNTKITDAVCLCSCRKFYLSPKLIENRTRREG